MQMYEIGSVLVLFIVIYFLFKLGVRLYQNDLGNLTFWGWVISVIGVVIGFNLLKQNNLSGFLGFLPMITYIVMNISSVINFSYDTKNKIKGSIFSVVASIISYGVTYSLFGFGVTEASISAIIAAGILGSLGFSA